MKNLSNLIFENNIDPDEYVDLELKNGTLWAKCNLGADNEWDLGEYFSWGDTIGYEINDEHCFIERNYKFYDKVKNVNLQISKTLYTKYCKTDNKIYLEPKDDAAYKILGHNWMIPSQNHFNELMVGTKYEWVNNYNNSKINGLLFKSIKNDNTLFIPASGTKLGNSIDELYRSVALWTNESFGKQSHAFQENKYAFAFTSWEYHGKRTTGISPLVKKGGNQIRPVIKK